MENRKTLEVKFYKTVDDALLKYAVIVSEYRGKWVFCKHRNRDTFEIPGGHREAEETAEQAARRELYEETGAGRFELTEIGPYSVISAEPGGKSSETFGMLYFAEITEIGPLPAFEMERIECFDRLPERLTYPLIQPKLLERAAESIKT